MAIAFRYNGDGEMIALKPLAADKKFDRDGVYWLEESNARSMKSHRHEFAWLFEAWKNLPEELMDLYPTSEHLRKRALIQAGYFNERIVDLGTKAAALRLSHMFKSYEPFSLIVVRGKYVVIRDAKSQSRAAMGSQAFQASKTAVMKIVADLLGITPDALAKNTEAHA